MLTMENYQSGLVLYLPRDENKLAILSPTWRSAQNVEIYKMNKSIFTLCLEKMTKFVR